MADVEMMTIANHDAEEKVLLEANETVMGRRVSSRLKAKEKRPYYGNNTRSKKTKKPKSTNEAEGSKVIQGSVDLMDQGLKEEDVIGGEGKMSDYQRVTKTQKLFNEYLRQSIQYENDRCKNNKDGKRLVKRPDLKAMSRMIAENRCLYYPIRRFGHLPGIDVGHQFYKRCEMVVLGMHTRWMHGIEYIPEKVDCKMEQYKSYIFPLALSVVLSGKYKDNSDRLESVVYSGQGKNDLLGNKEQVGDQEMKSGNLALKNNKEQNVPVRLIRGCTYKNKIGTVYTYDGLYMVTNHWEEAGEEGYLVCKYMLKRMEGQPKLNSNPVIFVRKQASKYMLELAGKVSGDISEGQEKIRICASNIIDDPPVAPMGFTYCKSIQIHEDVTLPAIETAGCTCKGACVDPRICACAKLNRNAFPYVDIDGKGYLIRAKSVVYECGPNCKCGPACINRTSQKGLRYQLEVFRTSNKGWAVRSLDFIPSGAPVCEYTGLLRRTDEIDNNVSENDYIFDIDCLQTMKGLDGRRSRERVAPTHVDKTDDRKVENGPEFCIDAGTTGGVARFINHSCAPNLFVQCVLSSHHDLKLARVMLFASDNIPALQELTYDYAYVLDSVVDAKGVIKKKPCYCGERDCRKRLH